MLLKKNGQFVGLKPAFLSPLRGSIFLRCASPRVAPWAAIFRRFAAYRLSLQKPEGNGGGPLASLAGRTNASVATRALLAGANRVPCASFGCGTYSVAGVSSSEVAKWEPMS